MVAARNARLEIYGTTSAGVVRYMSWSEAFRRAVRPLAEARGVRRSKWSTGPAHALRAPLLTPSCDGWWWI